MEVVVLLQVGFEATVGLPRSETLKTLLCVEELAASLLGVPHL